MSGSSTVPASSSTSPAPCPRRPGSRRPCRRHRPGAGHGRGRSRRQRPPGHGDEPGAGGLPPLPARAGARPRRPRLDRSRPVRPVVRALQPHAVRPAVPERLRPPARRTSSSSARWGSLTPGHPEHGHTAGVETTTGPLGQGVANAVGMAMAARRERELLDPDAPLGESVFDHRVWVLASDGDLQEGVSAEASSLAGHLGLGALTLVYDDNRISIEGHTDLSFTEDVGARYEAYGWHVQHVDLAADGDVDLEAFAAACDSAAAETDRPSLIVLRTTIAWPAPKAQNTSAAHGAALGAAEVAATKTILGFDPEASFVVDPQVLAHARLVGERGAQAHARWQERFDAWRAGSPELPQPCWRGWSPAGSPTDWRSELPTFEPGTSMATRKASGAVINALADVLPELWGGSADLGESNNTTLNGVPSFLPVGVENGSPGGRRAALRHPRARHGLDHERHRAARSVQGVRRHVPGVQRLHASGGADGGAHGAAGHLRVDARLDRPRRGRSHPPAGRAPGRPARDPRAGRGASGRCHRDRGRVGREPRPELAPHRPGAHPAGRAGARSHRGRGLRAVRWRRRPGRAWRLRPGREPARRRHAGRHPHRHRFGGPARPAGPARPRRPRDRRPGGLDAVRRVVPRRSRRTTATRCCCRRCGPGCRSRPGSPRRGASSSATTAPASGSTTSGPRPTRSGSTASSGSPLRRWSRRPSTWWGSTARRTDAHVGGIHGI